MGPPPLVDQLPTSQPPSRAHPTITTTPITSATYATFPCATAFLGSSRRVLCCCRPHLANAICAAAQLPLRHHTDLPRHNHAGRHPHLITYATPLFHPAFTRGSPLWCNVAVCIATAPLCAAESIASAIMPISTTPTPVSSATYAHPLPAAASTPATTHFTKQSVRI
jgi:hypothetical protein